MNRSTGPPRQAIARKAAPNGAPHWPPTPWNRNG
jgi:hypothetical protein